MSTVGDTLYQYGGMPVNNTLLTNKIFSTKTKGRAWFVDTAQGTNGNGRSPRAAFTTMQQAFDVVKSGDIIYFVGKVTEQLVTPVDVFDVTVVGAGNAPRNADATPTSGNYAAAQWGPPASGAVAGQATVRVQQQGWRFVNILFTMQGSTAGGVEFVRNSASGDDERDGSHGQVLGCRFSGAGIGVKFGASSYAENVFNVTVKDNIFNDNTYAIRVTNGGAYRAQIVDNVFETNTNHIVGAFTQSNISYNTVSSATTGAIVLTGGAGNQVSWNSLDGTYAAGTLYAPGTNDNWNGNAASTGFTAAVPS